MKNIGKKQIEILDFIKLHLDNNGYPPTVREICAAVNLSSSATVHSHLKKLEEKGYIKRDPSTSRSILIIDDNFKSKPTLQTIDIPIIGKVTAGSPIEAVENIIDYFPMPANKVPKEDVFMLKVVGDSMLNKGIFEDDLILVKKQNYAYNGDIVVALIDNFEATVKTFYKEKDHIRLQPENDIYKPIILEYVDILGKVIGLYRDI